ncbi:GEVED domain-containing protein [Lacinutrix neustonica]|uniref:GEVED domain-containing protein n=1 Tax=Lacinutrix neustonica TaxID=2980107 RepID=A0A9E8MVH8_9FLAO|nr:GEVED domain-containing protein [Lacinutrix neustonica]WAC01720.1 GEVED domain-containing protein [Lacinutrix neustonica]
MACDGSYCVPTFTDQVYPITNISFAGINRTTTNTTPGGASTQGFCNTANVQQGDTYTLTMQANCGGNNRFYEKAYFDWNQNGTFGDAANEIYYMGSLYGTYGNDGVTLSYPIDVPVGASTGNTRMRVMHRFNGYSANACQTGAGYGQAEDYNVSVTALTNYCIRESLNDETVLYFNNVEFIGTLNDVSNLNNSYSTSPQGYQDHTAITNSVQAQGEGMNVFVESNATGRIKAWIDWNKDFVFDEATEKVYDTGIAASSTTFGFIIPPGQAVGDYRIRIRTYSSYHYYYGTSNNTYDYTACETFYQNGNYNEYGETEDYTFTVVESCDATITSLTEANTCGPGTVTLGVTGSPSTTSFNWYANSTDTTPLATTNTGSWTTPSISATTDYYVTAVNGTCESLVKTKITATILTITTLTFTPSVPEVCGEDDIIELAASAENEIIYLIDEDFEGAGLGSFSNNNIADNGASENAATMWQQRTSTFVPSEQVWFPAIASGFKSNKFVMATSDVGTSNIKENALESALLDASNFLDLTLSFDMYFSRYKNSNPEYVSVDVSTDSGTTWTTVQQYNNDIGYGTNFANLSLDLSSYIAEPTLKVRIRYFADAWCDGVAVDNIQLYGSKPLASSFTWTSSTPIDAYLDAAATNPYTAGTAASLVYVKPTTIQLQSPTFSFTATASLSNGCTVSETISINNKTLFWTGGSSTDWNDPSNWSQNNIPTANSCVIIPR